MFWIVSAAVVSLQIAPVLCEMPPGLVRFPLNRLKADSLFRRDTTANGVLNANIENLRTHYALKCSLGTPSQNLELVIDTGSSDSWVMSPEVNMCQEGECEETWQFDSSDSSTYKSNGTQFYQVYGDGSEVSGTWSQDTLTVSATSIKNFNFALANFSTASNPVAGIGLPKGETPLIIGSIAAPYANLPQQLKSNGHIAHVAYSLYLDAASESEGSILFGGVNTGAYNGTMYTHPMVPVDTDEIDRLAINLQGIFVMNDNGEQQQVAALSIPVVLDSGSTLSILPDEILGPLMEGMGAIYYPETQRYWMKCDKLFKNRGGIGLVFSNVEYIINFHDVMVDAKRGYCSPGFTSGEIPLLGDNILRALYVVYDLENLEIGLARVSTAPSISTSYQPISKSIAGEKAPGYNSTSFRAFYDVSPVTILGNKPSATNKSGKIAGSGDSSLSDGIDSSTSVSHGLILGSKSSVQISITVGGLATPLDTSAASLSLGSRILESSPSTSKSSNGAVSPTAVFAGGVLLGCLNLVLLLL